MFACPVLRVGVSFTFETCPVLRKFSKRVIYCHVDRKSSFGRLETRTSVYIERRGCSAVT